MSRRGPSARVRVSFPGYDLTKSVDIPSGLVDVNEDTSGDLFINVHIGWKAIMAMVTVVSGIVFNFLQSYFS